MKTKDIKKSDEQKKSKGLISIDSCVLYTYDDAAWHFLETNFILFYIFFAFNDTYNE